MAPITDDVLPADIASSPNPVGAYGFITPAPGAGEDLLREFAAGVLAARAAAGCEDFTVHRSSDDDALVIYERWSSGAQWEQYLLAQTTQAFYARVAPLLARPFEGHFVHSVAIPAQTHAS